MLQPQQFISACVDIVASPTQIANWWMHQPEPVVENFCYNWCMTLMISGSLQDTQTWCLFIRMKSVFA